MSKLSVPTILASVSACAVLVSVPTGARAADATSAYPAVSAGEIADCLSAAADSPTASASSVTPQANIECVVAMSPQEDDITFSKTVGALTSKLKVKAAHGAHGEDLPAAYSSALINARNHNQFVTNGYFAALSPRAHFTQGDQMRAADNFKSLEAALKRFAPLNTGPAI